MSDKLFPTSGRNTTLGQISSKFDSIESSESAESDITKLDFSKLTADQVTALKAKLGL